MFEVFSQRHTEPRPQPAVERSLIAAARLDRAAVLLSGICVLHCLLAPIALTLLPIVSISAFWEDMLFHRLMLFVVLPTSSIALFIGCRKHRDWKILSTGIIGMMALVLIAIAGHDVFTPVQEKIATSCAGIILAVSHLLNFRACQRITCADDNCSSKHHH